MSPPRSAREYPDAREMLRLAVERRNDLNAFIRVLQELLESRNQVEGKGGGPCPAVG